MVDAPWQEHGAGRSKRGADRHYETLSAPDIYRALILSGHWFPAPNAHLYFWVTDNFLLHGLRLVQELGFRYVRTLIWVKSDVEDQEEIVLEDIELQTGLGQYFRGAHEICLFGVLGDGYAVRTDARNLLSVLVAKRAEHSAKPEEFYRRVEARSHGPYCEFFARNRRHGWQAWGNQVEQGA